MTGQMGQLAVDRRATEMSDINYNTYNFAAYSISHTEMLELVI